MKRVLLVALALVLIGLGLGCSSGGGQALTLGSAPWKDGERAVYNVLDGKGTTLGSEELVLSGDGSAWILTVTDKIPPLDQTFKVRIDATSLKPLGEEKTIRTTGTNVTLNTAYTAGKLQINAVVNGENRSASVDVPANSLDNDQLLVTLRALPFAAGYQTRLVTVVAANATKVNTTVTVIGKETVQIPAGSLEAWKVELNFAGAKQTAWYEVAAPHRMVQYDNGAARMVLTEG